MSWQFRAAPPIDRNALTRITRALSDTCASLTLERAEHRLTDDTLFLALNRIEHRPTTVEHHLMAMGITRPTALKNLRELKACEYAEHRDQGWFGTQALSARVDAETRPLTRQLSRAGALGLTIEASADDVLHGFLRTELWARQGFSPLAGARQLGFFHLLQSCHDNPAITTERYEELATRLLPVHQSDTVKRWAALDWINCERDKPVQVNPLGHQIARLYAEQLTGNIQIACQKQPETVA
ncbi:hypothetical protein GH975_02980 [Litorivicinus lipolyticus]|uniref:Uncharacterized protein n=1 Tax=Litorivicinus lipolyticus TaxID=418701 RepID=A0A5Q2QC50_9GAMM|nr:hypothetical protein [Litorivicinus lipolyticus]QGG79586.1 hypothetical protein GH975_02980 [Litorivicinus lipolyticus]